jgi:hypothetical protein
MNNLFNQPSLLSPFLAAIDPLAVTPERCAIEKVSVAIAVIAHPMQVEHSAPASE